MEDIYKPAGATKASKPDAGGGVIRSVPVYGTVKNNVDPTRSGRLQVYIADLGGNDPDDPNNWATVSYMSPFYGFVEPTAANTGLGDFTANPASYGVWNSPPDLESLVICVFINGDPNYGYYIGCVPKAEALHMVPAIGASEKVIVNNDSESQSYGGASRLPVTNINTNNSALADGANFLDEAKPVHSYLASILFKQGLIRDNIRGPISSSAQRETPSRVGWGVSSPGRPIYAGGYTDSTIAGAVANVSESGADGLRVISRRGGHSIVLDDGDLIGKDQLVRIRSAGGHQILMSDDGQTLFIIHSNGQSWVELGKEGTIDMFCTNSFNVRTLGDINFHADNDINIHAKKKLNIQAEDITMLSEKSTSHSIGTDYKIDTKGTFTHKVGGAMSMQSGGEASYASGSTTYINGSVINLNTGATGTTPETVAPIPIIAHTDTLFDSIKGYIAAPGKLNSITTRAPAHAPWVNANQGVSIQTSTNASSNLPPEPSAQIIAANEAAAAAPISTPVTSAAVSTVPAVSSISKSIDKPTTGALLAAVSTNAATGPAATAVKTGAGIVKTAKGAVASIGSFAQSPKQLELSGFLKPGSSVLIDSLIQSGSTLSNSLTTNLFTGQGGIGSLASYLGNQPAQISSVVNTFQQAQTSLTASGIMTGKESPIAIAGLVFSGATAGVTQTINAFKTLSPTKILSSGLATGISGTVSSALNSGNFAAAQAQSSTSGLSSIMTAIGVVGLVAGAKSNTRGATATAFTTIASSLTALGAGKALNLGTISGNNIRLAQARSAGYVDPLQSASQIIKTTGQIMGGSAGRISNAVAGGLTSISRLNSASTPTQSITAANSVLSSVGNLANALGNKSVSKSIRDVNSIISAGRQIDRSLSKLLSSRNTIQSLGSVGGLLNTVGQIGRVFGNKNIAKTANKINKTIAGTNQFLRAYDSLLNSTNINSAFSSVNGIISGANRIASSTGNTAKSSGLFSLPGGALSVGSIVNKSLGSFGIPRNPVLSNIISQAVTSSLNDIAFPKSVQGSAGLSTLAGLGGQQLSSAFSKLQSSKMSLSSYAFSGLPPGEAVQYSSAMSSIGFGGASSVKMPSIGINTGDFAEVNAQVTGLLGDSRIPAPDFSEEPTSSASQLDLFIQQNNQVDGLLTEVSNLNQKIEVAEENYYDLENALPQGDPQLDAARQEWTTLVRELETKLQSIDGLINFS